jgi:hypothetical protein
MPLQVAKVSDLIISQNVCEILFIIMCGISTISDSSIYQWVLFPLFCTTHLFLFIRTRYKLKKYYKEIFKIKHILIENIVAVFLNIGIGTWYNVFIIRKEEYSAIVIGIHNLSIFFGFLILILGLNIINKFMYNRQAVDYYNDSNKNSIAEVGILETVA